MDSTQLKHVLNVLKVGKYKASKIYLTKNKLESISGDSALKVLIVAVQGLKFSNESPKCLVEIVRMLEFDVMNGNLLSNYIGCIYHIVKYIISSKNLEFITQLENYIVPPFIENIQLEDEHVTTLKCLHSILNNNFLDILNNITSYDTDFVYTNCKMLINLSVSAIEHFIPRIQTYVTSLLNLEFNTDKIEELYNYLYVLIESKDVGGSEQNFKNLMVMLSNMCKYFAAQKEFGRVLWCVRVSESKLVESAGDNGDFVERVLAVSPLFTSFDSYPETAVEILDNFMRVIESRKCKFYADLMVPFITKLFHEALQASEDSDVKRVVDDSFAAAFVKAVDVLGKLSLGIEFKCCCGINYDVYSFAKSLTIKSFLMKHLIMFQESNEDLHATVISHFRSCFEFWTLLKKMNCQMLNYQWRLSGSILYNIAMKLYQEKDKACIAYLKLFSKAALEFENILMDISNRTLQSLVEILMLNAEYESGLQVSALNVFLYRDSSKWALQQWSRCKCALGHKFRNATLVTVLNENEANLKTYYEGFNKVTDPEKIIDLLMLELNTYKKYWPYSIYYLLCELKEYTDLVTLAKEIALIEYTHLIKSNRNILKDLLEPCIEELESMRKDGELHRLLGYLYFLFFKFSFLNLVDKNHEELNSTIPPPKPEQSEPVDVNNECDINPAYQFLEVSTCNKTFRYLNKSLDSFKVGIQSGIAVSKNFVTVSLELAYEFKLHCNLLDFLKAMFLTLDFAEGLKDDGLVIRSLAAIMEHLDVDSKMFQSFKLRCDDIIARVEGLDLKIYCRYYTSLTLAYIKCDRFKECNEMYDKASDYYYKFHNDDGELDSRIVKLYYLYSETLLVNAACMHSITNHDSLALSRLYSTYCLISQFLKLTKTLSPEFLSIAMDAMENLLNLYVSMRLPREVRCFGRGVYELTQELVLPFRVARLTIFLANADLLSCRFGDCEVKLEKLSNILGLSRNTRKEDKVLCEITLDVDDWSLGNPSIHCANSPKLFTRKFKLPSFTTHELKCDCFPCSSIEYKDLVMQKIHLDAMLSAAYDDTKSSFECFKGISSIYKHVSKMELQTPEDVSLNVQFYTSTYNHCILDCARIHVKQVEFDKASTLNTRLYKKMRREVNKSFYLYNEVLKLNWVLTDKTVEVIQEESEEALELNEDVKTPEQKSSFRTPSPVLHSPLAALKPKDFNIKSPEFLAPKTPMVNFKIFTPESMKKPMNSARKRVRKDLSRDLDNAKETKNKVKKPVMKIFCDESDGDENPKKPAPRSTRKTTARRLLEQQEFTVDGERLTHPELIKSAKKFTLKSINPDDEDKPTHLELLKSAKKFTLKSINPDDEDKPTHLELLKSAKSKKSTPALRLLDPKPIRINLARKFLDVQDSASKGAVRKYTRRKDNDVLTTPRTYDRFKKSTDEVFDALIKSLSNSKGAVKKEIADDGFDENLQDVESDFKSLRINVLDIEPVESVRTRAASSNCKEEKMRTDEVSVGGKLEVEDVAEKRSTRLKKLADSKGGNDVKVKRTTRRNVN